VSSRRPERAARHRPRGSARERCLRRLRKVERIDSLFLDEGFGSLDTAILSDALDVLRGHVSTGRLVAVTCHLRAVAADLDRVLLVTKNPGGSDVRWLEPAEREQLLLNDVSTGLLS
jgi:exonuclease SbcC